MLASDGGPKPFLKGKVLAFQPFCPDVEQVSGVIVSYCLVNFSEDTYQNSKLKASNGRNLDVLMLAYASYSYLK